MGRPSTAMLLPWPGDQENGHKLRVECWACSDASARRVRSAMAQSMGPCSRHAPVTAAGASLGTPDPCQAPLAQRLTSGGCCRLSEASRAETAEIDPCQAAHLQSGHQRRAAQAASACAPAPEGCRGEQLLQRPAVSAFSSLPKAGQVGGVTPACAAGPPLWSTSGSRPRPCSNTSES